jgi:hypothetical protein
VALAPGPLLVLVSHDASAMNARRTVLEITPRSLFAPFVVHSKYVIGGRVRAERLAESKGPRMSSRFLSQPQTQLRADGSVERTGGRIARFVCRRTNPDKSRALPLRDHAGAGGRAKLARDCRRRDSQRARVRRSQTPEFHLDYGDTEIGVWSWSRKRNWIRCGPSKALAMPESILPRACRGRAAPRPRQRRRRRPGVASWTVAVQPLVAGATFSRGVARLPARRSGRSRRQRPAGVVQTLSCRATEPPRRSILHRAAQFKGLAHRATSRRRH